MTEETQKKTIWQSISDAVRNPASILSGASKSPIITGLAIVFLVQPIVMTGLSLFREWRSVQQVMSPESRPVTKAEFQILNEKVDFITQQLIIKAIAEEYPNEPEAAAALQLPPPPPPPPPSASYPEEAVGSVEIPPPVMAAPPPPPAAIEIQPPLAEAVPQRNPTAILGDLEQFNRRLEVLQNKLDKQYVEKQLNHGE